MKRTLLFSWPIGIALVLAFVFLSPAGTQADAGWSCPAGTTLSWTDKTIADETFSFTVPNSPWNLIAVKAGFGHQVFGDGTVGLNNQTFTIAGQNAISHIDYCKVTTVTPTTTTEVPPSTTTTVPDSTSSTTTVAPTTTGPSTSIVATTTTVTETTTSTTSPPTSSTTSSVPPSTSTPPTSVPVTSSTSPTTTQPPGTTTTPPTTAPPTTEPPDSTTPPIRTKVCRYIDGQGWTVTTIDGRAQATDLPPGAPECQPSTPSTVPCPDLPDTGDGQLQVWSDCTTTPTGTLPETGSGPGANSALAAGLVGIGTVLAMIGRRRNTV